MWLTTVGANMAIQSTLVVCDDMCYITYYVAGWLGSAHDNSTAATCFETLPNISPIGSAYFVIWHMNATLLLLVYTRNHPSLVNKKCSTWLYQSHGLNLSMQLVFGKAGFMGCIVY